MVKGIHILSKSRFMNASDTERVPRSFPFEWGSYFQDFPHLVEDNYLTAVQEYLCQM